MINHQDIQNTLQTTFANLGNATLLSRYADPQLQLTERQTHVFVPDFHLLSHEDAREYPNQRFPHDGDVIRLLEQLRDLKKANPHTFFVWHIGDLFDIWRARGGRGPTAEGRAIIHDHAEIIRLLRDRPEANGCKARFIIGNHDYSFFDVPTNKRQWQAARFRFIKNAGGGEVLVLHGDIFKWIERLPDELQARAVRFAKRVSGSQADLFNNDDDLQEIGRLNREMARHDPTGEAQADLTGFQLDFHALATTAPINVIDGDAGDPKAKNKEFFKAAKALAESLNNEGRDVRAMVIGHTHYARIIKGTLKGGRVFALMDCGSWAGLCRLAPTEPFRRCAQLGALVNNELRIYQLGSRPDL